MRGLVVLLIFLLTISLVSASKVDEVIEEELEEQDEVSVIVKLKDEKQEPFSIMNKEEYDVGISERKKMVERQQDRVLANIRPVQMRTNSIYRARANPDFKLEQRYSVINGFSGDVTRQGLETLRNDPNVESVYANVDMHIHLDESVPRIKATSTWGLIYNNSNIMGKGETVCVIDTGIDYTHPNLGNCSTADFLTGDCSKIIGGYDYIHGDNDPMDDMGHGTHVAGIIVSDHPTYRGVAPDAKIVALKACYFNGNCSADKVVASMDWCLTNAATFNISIISMSLGGGSYTSACDGINAPTADESNFAANLGFFVVASSGNNPSSSTSIGSPACASNVTAVGGVNDNDVIGFKRAPFMSIVAPGVGIMSTVLRSGGGIYDSSGFKAIDGTSMAAPHVAGAGALLLQYKRLEKGQNLTFSEIRNAFNSTGVDVGDSGITYKRINVLAALLSLDTTAPEITFVAPTFSNNTRTSNTDIFINITSDEILSTAILEWNNGTKINQTMNGSGTNWYVNKTDLLELGYSYTVFGNDSAGNLGVSELRLVSVNTTNTIPEVEVAINSTDNLNRTNGTLIGSWVFSDLDNNNQTLNETKWFNNSIEISELINLTSVRYTNTTKNQNWNFSVRVYDGINWSEWVNATITIMNAVPELEEITAITVNETYLVNITANATDIDDDIMIYAVNDSRFSNQSNKFTWLTTTADSGIYHVNVIANDSEDIDSQIVIVTVLDAADFDDDGNPDYNDTDDDNDGIDDASDFLMGNVSDIDSTVALKLKINGSENLTQIFNDTLKINVTDENNNSLIEFDWNFTDAILAINWTVDYAPENGTIIIRDLDVEKTVYINKSSSSHNYVCIADYDITSISLMSSGCSAANETKVPCTGSAGGYSCTNLGNSFRISGIAHSGVKGIQYTPPSDDDNGGGSGGGGSTGGGGGGGTAAVNPNEASRFFVILTETFHPLIGINSPNIPIERLSFDVNKKLHSVRVNIKALSEEETPVKISGNVYQYLELTTQNLNDTDLAEAVEIKFKVSKEWLNENKVDKKDIALYRYKEKWNKLDTEIEKEDNSTVFYASKTPGFSIFAIAAAKEIKEVKEKPKEEIKIQEAEEAPAITEIEGEEVEEESDDFFVIVGRAVGGAYKERPLVAGLLTAFMLVIVAVFLYTTAKEKRKKKPRKKIKVSKEAKKKSKKRRKGRK